MIGPARIQCALELKALSYEFEDLANWQQESDQDIVEISDLPKNLNERLVLVEAPISQIPSSLDGIQATAAIKHRRIEETARLASSPSALSENTASSLTTLEESVCLLWDRQPAVESEAEFSTEIHMMHEKSNNSSQTPPIPTDQLQALFQAGI